MGNDDKGFEFKKFATPRIIGGIAIVVIVLWALSIIFSASKDHASAPGDPHGESPAMTASKDGGEPAAADHDSPDSGSATGHTAAATDTAGQPASAGHATGDSHSSPAAHSSTDAQATHDNQAAAQGSSGMAAKPAMHQQPATRQPQASHQQPPTHQQSTTTADHGAAASGQATDAPTAEQHGAASGHPIAHSAPAHKPKPKGVAFVEAAIQPLSYELEERWWGWRPNDIVDLTDNVNSFQMGVLEVTRRTTVALAERISRTGSTDAFDENLEQAMNWFMVKATSYWFPSAESKYLEGLEELQAYHEKLMQGKATFYTRTDNLIPMLSSFEDLLGSCDENLVKQVNEDGSEVSHFSVDNYFYYTQGVASAMATVLEAVHHDFLLTLEQRNGTELLHHAIVSCQKAKALAPWIILDSDLSSVLANHRANMAAPISHARFYIGQLIKTLST